MKQVLALAAAAAAVAATFTALPASADPVGAPQFRELAGMGSDTTFEVMNGLSQVVIVGGNKVIGSYDPQPAGAIVNTKDETSDGGRCNTAGGAIPNALPAAPNGGVPRANGSSAGRDALNAAVQPNSPTLGCLEFARSSSGAIVAGQTFVPLAEDGLTYAFPLNGDIGAASTTADLRLIYQCNAATAGVFRPLIPQTGSGTRNSWATLMGISNVTLPSCVSDRVSGPGSLLIQEHDGRVLTTSNSIVPFSVAQYLSQQFGVTNEVRGSAQLGQLDGVVPVIQNPSSPGLRTVGNILTTADFNDAASLANDVFVNNGSGKSQVCVNGASTISRFGFIPSFC